LLPLLSFPPLPFPLFSFSPFPFPLLASSPFPFPLPFDLDPFVAVFAPLVVEDDLVDFVCDPSFVFPPSVVVPVLLPCFAFLVVDDDFIVFELFESVALDPFEAIVAGSSSRSFLRLSFWLLSLIMATLVEDSDVNFRSTRNIFL
jgi:hypothetical protein